MPFLNSFFSSGKNADKLEAINRSQAIIEFKLDGTIVSANENFLNAMGYTLNEVKGKHHSMFVEPEYAKSAEYKEFWEKLGRGEFEATEYKRLAKGGREVWIQASYNPLRDGRGKPYGVVKFATDITAEKMKSADYHGQLDAISKSQAVIQFHLDGTIIEANENFLGAIGYSLAEIKGKHHSMFVEPSYAKSPEYKDFWSRLGRGEFDSGEYKRLAKGGREIWIQASYNPIFDMSGKPFKVVKYATDITAEKLKNADFSGQLEAIGKSQAVIQFNLDGTIIDANENFLKAMGYRLEDIQGKHHSIFVEPGYAKSPDYKEFWARLGRGEFESAEYKRLAKGGREVWIQASYNPIFDMNGKPFKVVKYATDITARKLESADFSGQLEAIGKSQAVIEFNLDGTIIDANENFLGAMGYALSEIQGKHHSMFVEPHVAQSKDYKEFWEKLGRGEFESRVYKRIGKGGKEVWIQASYNPIFDMNGVPFKVVKYATDVTDLMKTVDLTDATSSKMQNVAAAIEEMSASVEEINNNMTLSKKVTDDISKKISMSGEASERLINTMQSMKSVVGLIRDIAKQVNLLALNATVEASRAGDSGKGFAVVASEIKNLAGQTAQATDDIAEQIFAVQSLSNEVSDSITDIVQAAASMSDYVNNVAGTLEEQNAVTRDIASNTQIASAAVDEVSQRIRSLSEAA